MADLSCDHQGKAKARRGWLPAFLLAVFSTLFVLGLGLRLPNAEEPVALVFAPEVSAREAMLRVAALEGRLVRPGGWGNVVVAIFDQDLSLRNLLDLGVWASLDPVFLNACIALRSEMRT